MLTQTPHWWHYCDDPRCVIYYLQYWLLVGIVLGDDPVTVLNDTSSWDGQTCARAGMGHYSVPPGGQTIIIIDCDDDFLPWTNNSVPLEACRPPLPPHWQAPFIEWSRFVTPHYLTLWLCPVPFGLPDQLVCYCPVVDLIDPGAWPGTHWFLLRTRYSPDGGSPYWLMTFPCPVAGDPVCRPDCWLLVRLLVCLPRRPVGRAPYGGIVVTTLLVPGRTGLDYPRIVAGPHASYLTPASRPNFTWPVTVNCCYSSLLVSIVVRFDYPLICWTWFPGSGCCDWTPFPFPTGDCVIVFPFQLFWWKLLFILIVVGRWLLLLDIPSLIGVDDCCFGDDYLLPCCLLLLYWPDYYSCWFGRLFDIGIVMGILFGGMDGPHPPRFPDHLPYSPPVVDDLLVSPACNITQQYCCSSWTGQTFTLLLTLDWRVQLFAGRITEQHTARPRCGSVLNNLTLPHRFIALLPQFGCIITRCRCSCLLYLITPYCWLLFIYCNAYLAPLWFPVGPLLTLVTGPVLPDYLPHWCWFDCLFTPRLLVLLVIIIRNCGVDDGPLVMERLCPVTLLVNYVDLRWLFRLLLCGWFFPKHPFITPVGQVNTDGILTDGYLITVVPGYLLLFIPGVDGGLLLPWPVVRLPDCLPTVVTRTFWLPHARLVIWPDPQQADGIPLLRRCVFGQAPIGRTAVWPRPDHLTNVILVLDFQCPNLCGCWYPDSC